MKKKVNCIVYILFIYFLVSCNKPITNSLKNIPEITSEPSIIEKDFSYIQGGSFIMGNENLLSDPDADPDEVALEVILNDYYLSKTEVTFEEYDKYSKDLGLDLVESSWYQQPQERGKRPVVNVSWFDAIKYANWLSKKNGLPIAYDENTGDLLDYRGKSTKNIKEVKGFRLPTEAEWEFAARERGKDLKYAWGNSTPLINGKPAANVPDESLKKANGCKAILDQFDDGFAAPAPVATFIPNLLGLYDMTGNVDEWCNDIYDSRTGEVISTNNRVIRGGSCDLSYRYLRIQERSYTKDYIVGDLIGFRLALSK